MNAKKFRLPNPQTEAIENQMVFSSILVSREKQSGYPKQMQDGVVFVSGDLKLMTKDGSNNVLDAIGLWKDGSEVTDLSVRYFRPTTLSELVTAFTYTDSRALERFFRDGSENNTHLNQLMCSFLRNNLEEQNVDVKELATTSFKVKEIVDDKAKTFYLEKEKFYLKKIQKYEEKIRELKQEQSGVTSFGETVVDEEFTFGEVVSAFNSGSQSTEQPQAPVETILNFFEANKEVEFGAEIVGQLKLPEFIGSNVEPKIIPVVEDVAQ